MPTCRQSRWPGTAPSRENANSIRDADVSDAVTQKNCATTQMKSSASAQFWLIDSVQIQGTRKPMFSTAPSVLGIASVTATSRMNPKMTETTTDMYMPTAAIREAWFVSSAMCAEASKPVIVYCAISRPVANTYQKIGLEKFISGLPKPEAFDRLAEDVAERLVVVRDGQQHDHDEDDARDVPVGRDRVQQAP